MSVYVLLVYSEVENRIAAFRKMLYEKLMVMPSSPDEQKKLIRLVSLVKFLAKPFILFCVESLLWTFIHTVYIRLAFASQQTWVFLICDVFVFFVLYSSLLYCDE